MIRRFTLICLAIAAFSGLHLYGVKRDAQVQDIEIARIAQEAKAAHGHAALLHAEYDLLSDPDRLKDLAGQVLKLQPTDPKQYVALADLDKRLPATGPLPPRPDAPQQAQTPEADVAPAPAPAPQPASDDQTKPDLVARATPVPVPAPLPAEKLADKSPDKPPEKTVEKAIDKPAEKLADKSVDPANDKAAQLARMMAMIEQPGKASPSAQSPARAAPPAPRPAPAKPSALAESRPQTPRPVQSAALPAPPRPIPAVVAQQPQPPAPFVGSALGMAHIHAAAAHYVAPNDGD
jgi:hypothetical protein